MICDECNKKEATVHMTKIINGMKREIHLCGECANEKELSNLENNFSIHNFLASLLEGSSSPNVNINYKKSRRCPQCGSTYNDFTQSGRLGCSICYETFNDLLEPLIRRIQGNTRHEGKVPKRSGASIRIYKNINNLKKKMQKLVEREEFEEAAKVRDEIRKLEKEIDDI